jgi:hypothetical protein
MDLVLRPLMLGFWTLVLWGTFLWLAFLLKSLQDGWGVAIETLRPVGTGANWTLANLLCMGLAALVWSLAAGAVWQSRASHARDQQS